VTRVGIEATYSFLPDRRWNPWVGSGIGVEWFASSLEDPLVQHSESTTNRGFTLALSTGIDRRSLVGFGPLLEAAVGEFTHRETEVGPVLGAASSDKHSGPIHHPALHAWILVGLRLVLNP
jgi:hypothetical protein